MNDKKAIVKLLNEISSLPRYEYEQAVSGYANIGFDEIADYFIANSVTVQKHGRWEKSGDPCVNAVCSACGGACWYYDCSGYVHESKFCPNCGAKMDGEDDG